MDIYKIKKDILYKLNCAFKDFYFYSTDHHYEYKGQRIGTSVTKFIEEYANEFDSQAVAEKVALKEGKTIQEVLDEWEYKNKFACEKGSAIHEFTQSLWEGAELSPQMFTSWIDNKEMLDTIDKISCQCLNFYNDYKDRLELVENEKVVGSCDFDIASAIDSLFINKLTGGLVLVDYKTNSDIHKNERYAKPMKAPLSHLKDTTLSHYFIQVSIYKYLIEKYTDLKVDEWFIVWFSENNEEYQIIDVPYLYNEVEKLMEWRIWG